MTFETFTKPLLEWYRQNHRKLPFRETKNPYHIWVSEIMAQQTQIATMLPYYSNWINQWPTITSLAQADESEILKAWEGLGYYSRAKNLHKAAMIIQENYDGQFPKQIEQIEQLPGIGDYTANAIASIAFLEKAIAVDGNVIRVMSRLLQDDRDFLKKSNKEELKNLLFNLLEDENPSDYAQALMELGALICTPMNVQCEQCPLNSICLSYEHSTQYDYPLKKVKKVNPNLNFDVYIVIKNNQILISRDDSDGLMKGLIRLPMLEKTNLEQPVLSTKHIFSHKTWLMDVYVVDDLTIKNPLYQWVNLEDLNELAMITAHRAILTSLGHLK